MKYAKKNNNIIYEKIEHSGVSTARNIGLKYAIGKYINFLDADDKWDFQAFRHVYYFFKYFKDIEIVAGRLKFFEAIKSYHPLDYKFYKTRVVNLTEEYNCIHISGPSSFFRNSFIKGKNFVEGVFSGEDTIFINNLLIIKPLIGFIKEAIYFYRRRADFSSAVQNQNKKTDFYFSQIKYVGQYLLDKSKNIYNKTLPFIQFYIGYNILFRIISPAFKFLNNSNYQEYCKIIINQLNEIEDKYILEQRFASLRLKILALSKKYNRDIRQEIYFENDCIIYSNYILINLNKVNNLIIWRFLEIKDNILHLEGKDNFWMPKENYFYFSKIGNKTFFPEYYEYSGYDFYTMFGLIDKGRVMTFNIPLEKDRITVIKIYLFFKNKIIEIFPSLGYFTHIPNVKNGYYSTKNFIIKQIEKRITVYQYNKQLENNFEKKYYLELHNLSKDYIIELRKKALEYQKISKQTKHKKEIWLINDSQNAAGDNGEYFFRYLINKNNKNIDVFFTIKKNSIDFKRLKKIGNILDLNSKDYLYTFLKSNKIISSVSDSWVINPFGEDQKYIRDLFHFDIIYLQNGIMKEGLSQSLNRINTNYSLFITTSKKEYNYLLTSNYQYNNDNIVLTGLSRFDNLYNLSKKINKEKIILLIPTWRNFIKGTIDIDTKDIIYSDSFKNTTYFNFYNNLINDKKLLSILKEFNFTGVFCLHPYYSKQYKDFNSNDYFLIKENCNFQELLVKASLFITDYSSLFFDFGYLKKPIVYIQFDSEEYRKFNSKGFFDYKIDAFGPVCNDIQCTINEIIKELKDDCRIKKKYLRKIKSFFAFSDNKNNDRIYFEITNRTNQGNLKLINLNKCLFIIFLSIFFARLYVCDKYNNKNIFLLNL